MEQFKASLKECSSQVSFLTDNQLALPTVQFNLVCFFTWIEYAHLTHPGFFYFVLSCFSMSMALRSLQLPLHKNFILEFFLLFQILFKLKLNSFQLNEKSYSCACSTLIISPLSFKFCHVLCDSPSCPPYSRK